jgi:hypothetical protein
MSMTKNSRPTHSIQSTSKEYLVSAPASPILGDELNPDPSDPQPQPPEEAQDEAIRLLAYHKWKAAGCPEGDGTEFWLNAEQEIKVE